MNTKDPRDWRYQQSYPKWTERKRIILDWLRQYGYITVNCKHTVQLNDNHRLAKDLRRLIKEKILFLTRDRLGKCGLDRLRERL